MSTLSNTPRTDTFICDDMPGSLSSLDAMLSALNFARRLERELQQWREVAERLFAASDGHGTYDVENDSWQARMMDAREAYNKLKNQQP